MTDAVAVALIAGVPLILGAMGNLYVIIRTHRMDAKVDKIEKQTNSMNSQMTDSARKEGRIEGKERAEQAAAVVAATVASTVAAVTATPTLPLVIAPEVKQDDIVRWVSEGIAKGIVMEKARRAAEGNGPR